jgi:hypothetical protein
MRWVHAAALAALSFVAYDGLAQQLAPGKYSGRVDYVAGGTQRNDSVSLNIEKVEGNRFQGSAWVGTPNCRADVPVQGKLDGDTMKVWGKGEKCGVKWELKLEGDKLEGTTSGGSSVRLSK